MLVEVFYNGIWPVIGKLCIYSVQLGVNAGLQSRLFGRGKRRCSPKLYMVLRALCNAF